MKDFKQEDIECLNQHLATVYDNTNSISTIPSCDCGTLRNRYQLGKICSDCGTKCKEITEKVYPLFWLKAPDPNIKFLSPEYWSILSSIINDKNDFLRWLCDAKYNPPISVPKHVEGIRELLKGIRSYSNTMENIPRILRYLMANASYKSPRKQEQLKIALDMFLHSKDELFSEHLPILNKQLFVMENTSKGRYTNLILGDAYDVTMSWIKAVNEEKLDSKKINSAMASAVSKLHVLYTSFTKKYVVQKSGIFRKHIYGARSPFTFRSVISSIAGPHRHDDIIIPWPIAVTLLKPMILNKLIRAGMAYKHASALLFRAVKKYEPEVAKILDILFHEAPDNRFAVLTQRNPSLKQGSAMLVYIAGYKRDVEDKTIDISQLIIKFPNGDYDGDKCWCFK